mmetsp:Transcript_101381/g.307674  ORF Transcript_101381/g.307674 Transcript_101381/m.307674 type:complete len:187 (-) Transcript_101381:40-600(-)
MPPGSALAPSDDGRSAASGSRPSTLAPSASMGSAVSGSRPSESALGPYDSRPGGRQEMSRRALPEAAPAFAATADSVLCRRRRLTYGPRGPSQRRLDELHRGLKPAPGRLPAPTLAQSFPRALSLPALPLTGASGTRSGATQARLPHKRERHLFHIGAGSGFYSDPMSASEYFSSGTNILAGPGAI